MARALIEAIAFVCLFALAQSAGGAAPLSLTLATFALIGATLVLVAVLRETGSQARGTAVVVTTLGAAVLLAVLLPAQRLDVVGWIARIIGFVILAEVYLWRLVSLARGAVRWSDARNAVPFAAFALALAAMLPVPLDRGPLVPLALVLIAASAVALSVARSAEELSLTRGAAAEARLSSANSAIFALGLGAMAAAAITPAIEQLLQDIGVALAPAFDQLIFYMLLPLGYLAALVFAILEPILRRLNLWSFRDDRSLRGIEEDEALLRDIERTRPFVIGGLEVLILIVVIIVALALLERAVRERRLTLPAGAQLERSPAPGLSVADTLRSLFRRGPARRRRPHEDGSPASALRLVYWRLLELAERAGHGWRSTGETPGEHQSRLAEKDARWNAAAPIVAAFEDLRYGEIAPDRATVARAHEALRAVETVIRT